MKQLTVPLTHGIHLDAGQVIEKASLRQIDGSDGQFLADISTDRTPVHRISILLLERLASFENVQDTNRKRQLLRNMSIGDRVALMLQMRSMALGDTMQCIICCDLCKKNMSIDLSINTLLHQASILSKKCKDEVCCIGVEGYELKIMPLTGSDQDMLSAKSTTVEKENLKQSLAKSCIKESNPRLPDIIPENLLYAVELKLSEIDPLSDIVLEVHCPSCGDAFSAPFWPEEFILQEVGTFNQQLEQEVHWLAFHYHWSEKEILALPMKKRRKYIELINATLAGENI